MSNKFWRGAEERTAELVAEFKHGKAIEQGPSVDDYEPDMGQLITDEINADPEEAERLRQSRVEARTGRRQRFTEILDQLMIRDAEILRRLALGPGVKDDFFEEDEPIEDVKAAFEAGEQHLTEPTGTGWCAPSP